MELSLLSPTSPKKQRATCGNNMISLNLQLFNLGKNKNLVNNYK